MAALLWEMRTGDKIDNVFVPMELSYRPKQTSRHRYIVEGVNARSSR